MGNVWKEALESLTSLEEGGRGADRSSLSKTTNTGGLYRFSIIWLCSYKSDLQTDFWKRTTSSWWELCWVCVSWLRPLLRFQNRNAVSSNLSYKPRESGRNLENFHVLESKTVKKQMIFTESGVHWSDIVTEGRGPDAQGPQGPGASRRAGWCSFSLTDIIATGGCFANEMKWKVQISSFTLLRQTSCSKIALYGKQVYAKVKKSNLVWRWEEEGLLSQ